MIVLERLARRTYKILRALFLRPDAPGCDWDEFYAKGVSDRQTIGPDKDPISARHHYVSVETLICRELVNHPMEVRNVLDLGSGAGHWLQFYRDIGAVQAWGIEIAEGPAIHLRNLGENVWHGPIPDFMTVCQKEFNSIVNAIGVMFHILSDADLIETLIQSYRVLRPGGRLIVGGSFHWTPANLNTQPNKRLRSLWWWRRHLRRAGFTKIRVYRNRAALRLRDQRIAEQERGLKMAEAALRAMEEQHDPAPVIEFREWLAGYRKTCLP